MDKIEVDFRELPGRFAELVAKAAAGEEAIVTEEGEPKAKLVSVPAIEPTVPPLRRLGLGVGRGTFWMVPDFDEPLPDEF
jgi:prevent-host-death family protein